MDLFAIQRSKYQRGIRASLSATPSTVGFHLGSSLGKYNPIFPCASPSPYTSAPPLPFTWLFVFCLFPACSYEYALNGFAARIELPAILQRLKQHPLVAAVNPMTAVKPSLNRSPTFLQLQDSLWKAEGGQTNAGKGVVLGVIDTGIWPENPFFRDVSVLVWQSA